MECYFERFPKKSKTELRTVTVLPGSDMPLPPGVYAFLEFYCTDRSCDCCRVLIKVMHDVGGEIGEVATISYCWENTDSTWDRLNSEFTNPFLDPLNPQTELSEFLLEFWADMVSHDTDYAHRLKRHYHEMRGSGSETECALTTPMSPAKRRALRDRRRKRDKRRPR